MYLYKKIKITAVILTAMIGFQSCDDIVDLEPVSSRSPNTFYKDNKQLEIALIGAYSGFKDAYTFFHLRAGELRSDNHIGTGNDVNKVALHNNTIANNLAFTDWADLYTTIDRVNRIINEGQEITGVSSDILGQAYALRAKVYFDIARVWGKAPLRLVSPLDPSDTMIAASDQETILNQVVLDVNRAVDLIGINPNDKFNFTKASAFCLQAEVFMWRNQNLLAKQALESLFALRSSSFVETPQDWERLFLNQISNSGYPEGPGKTQEGSELIMSIRYELLGTASGVARTFIHGGESTLIDPLLELKWTQRFPLDNTWDEIYPLRAPVFSNNTVSPTTGNDTIIPVYGDWRLFASRQSGDFEDGFGSEGFGSARTTKWQKNRDGIQTSIDDTDIVLFRHADMVLLLAEAELKLGNTDRSLELINSLRTARQLPLATSDDFGANFNQRIDYLLDERQFELLGEGKRWWDLVRNNKQFEVMNRVLPLRNGRLLDESTLFWPISQEALVRNPALLNSSDSTGDENEIQTENQQ